MVSLSFEEVEKRVRYLKRGVEQLIEKHELETKIEKAHRENRSLVVKLGVDPTAPELHLGHTVPLMKLKQFQDLGYDITFLIGDFTGRIGDPSGRSSVRNAMTEEQVLKNAEYYKKQIFKIINPDKTKIVYNSEWLKPIGLEDFILMLGKGTVNELIKRRSVSMRLEEGNTVSVAEFVYPFLQAYDSVALKADVELGGTDQFYNLVFTREFQRAYGQEPEVIMTLPLLTGTDGKEKMSKTYNNHIAMKDSPEEMYGKLMSIPDDLIVNYFDLLTSVPFEEITQIEVGLLKGTLHPRDLKAKLAKKIVTQYHNKKDAIKAEESFDRIHKYKMNPEEIESICLNDNTERELSTLLIELSMTDSRNNARRLIEQGGVRIDNNKISDPFYKVTPYDGMIVNVGKRHFKQIKYKS